MKRLAIFLGLGITALLSACGGGSGSPGDTKLEYRITLRADKYQLPVNLDPNNNRASSGAYAPYSTVLYVQATEGGAPIPGGEDIFACNVDAGLNVGALYYLDGKEEHMVTLPDNTKVPGAYRSVILGSNSGGNSFHFHADSAAGKARITCSVTNPRDNQISSASVDIVVGGATGLPASVIGRAQQPGYLGSRDNAYNIRNSVGVQAFVMDDANQPVADPVAPNLQVSILPQGAFAGASLLADGQAADRMIQVRTLGGIGSFSLSSGLNRGVILLALTTDRFDNNVGNGIQDAVTQLMAVPVVHAVAADALKIVKPDLKAINGVPFLRALEATGGVPPYQWTILGGLPAGLDLSSAGIISGTPKAPKGTYTVAVRVTDDTGVSVMDNLSLTLDGDLPFDPLVMGISGCGSDVNVACKLPNATEGSSYRYAFSATGGDPKDPITWDFNGLPTWLTSSTTGNVGVVSGTPAAAADCGTHNFFVTAKRGTMTVTRQVSVTVQGGTCPP